MTIRKFEQHGQGYGADAVEIRAKIDGVVVFEGAAPTLDEPIPTLPAVDVTTGQANKFRVPELIGKIFEWQSTVEFSGTVALEIEVLSGGALLIAMTVADCVDSSNSATVGSFYTNEGGINDPLSTVAINGVLEIPPVRDLDPGHILNGQWFRIINTGDVLTAQITVQPGRIPEEPWLPTPVADPVAPA